MLTRYLFALGLCLALTACSSGENTNTSTETQSTATSADIAKAYEKSQTQQKTFGMTLAQFGQQFTQLAKDLGIGDFAWKNPAIEKGPVNDMFEINLNKNMSMNGVLAKNGELKEILFTVNGNDIKQQDTTGLIILIGMTTRILAPDIPKEKAAGAMLQTITEAMKEFNQDNNTIVQKELNFGQVKGKVSISKELGMWISFTPL